MTCRGWDTAPARRVHAVVAAVCGSAYRWTTEVGLQNGVAEALRAAGHTVEVEVPLTERDRLDLLVDGDIAVEVKIDGGLMPLTRQVHRYLRHERLAALVVVTPFRSLCRLPERMNDKPLRVALVRRAGGLW